MPAEHDLTVLRGETFLDPIRWEAEPFLYLPITGISQTAPLRITSVGHGLPDGWRVAIVSVKGMVELNAKSSPPADDEYHVCTVVDADTIELNRINGADFKPYQGGGYLQCYSPVDLSDYTGRMSIKTKKGGTEILRLTTENGGLIFDNVDKVIWKRIEADATAAITNKSGVYDLEVEDSSGRVIRLAEGSVTFDGEVTTP